MSRSIILALAATVAIGGVSVARAAEAHGWTRHDRPAGVRQIRRQRQVSVQSYEPLRYAAIPRLWGWGCGLRPFVTSYGALAYREGCH